MSAGYGQQKDPSGQFGGPDGGGDTGEFQDLRFRTSHRDNNTMLTIQLADLSTSVMAKPGVSIRHSRVSMLTDKPGPMIAMDPTIALKGSYKFQ